MGIELRERWGGQPLWARWVLAGYLIGFLEGSCVHILDLARDGIHAYASFPQASLQVFFVSLAMLDPLVAVLVGLVRREGIWLASAVMVTDVFANWWGNRHWLQDDPAKLVWLSPITLFGLFVVAFFLPLHRAVVRTTRRAALNHRHLADENDTLPTTAPPAPTPAGRRRHSSSPSRTPPSWAFSTPGNS